MKLARIGVLAGILVLGLCVGESPVAASTQALGGYAAFRPFPNYASQTCVSDYYGGAVNSCGSTLDPVIFELPGNGNFQTTVFATSFGSGGTFHCKAYSYYEDNTATFSSGGDMSFSTGNQVHSSTVTMEINGSFPLGLLRVICASVPNGRGMGGFDW